MFSVRTSGILITTQGKEGVFPAPSNGTGLNAEPSAVVGGEKEKKRK